MSVITGETGPNFGAADTPDPLDQVRTYLRALQTTDLGRYVQVEGILDGVMYGEPIPSHEPFTNNAIQALDGYLHRPHAVEWGELNASRKHAAVHVVRSMIQGNVFPTDQFGDVIDEVLETMARIDRCGKPLRQHKKDIRYEIMDVWPDSDLVTKRRAAEAFKFVGRPRHYGRLMAHLAAEELS